MPYPLINGATINGDASTDGMRGIDLVAEGIATAKAYVVAGGDVVMSMAEMRVQFGIDIQLKPAGLDLVREGWHSAIQRQPHPYRGVIAGGDRVMSVGTPSVVLGAVSVEVGGDRPMEVGSPSPRHGVVAGGDVVFSVGNATARFGVVAGGDVVLAVGRPTGARAAAAPGINLVREGRHKATARRPGVVAGGDYVMSVGAVEHARQGVYVRGEFAMKVGRPSASKGGTC